MAETLTEKVYRVLREDIVNLRMKPGDKISEVKLADIYNVSRGPIRNVIQKLQQENLVVVKPQVGTVIAPISLENARDILEIRLLLEPHAAEIAAKHIQEEDIEFLENKFEELNSSEDLEKLFETDIALHQTIWRLCGNKIIPNIINSYRDEIQRIRLSTIDLANRLVPTVTEMKKIFEALKARSPEGARESMYAHILNIKNAIEAVNRNLE
ncbi:MAG: GntR family transcriptional regulator [Desulfobacterales bacterium]